MIQNSKEQKKNVNSMLTSKSHAEPDWYIILCNLYFVYDGGRECLNPQRIYRLLGQKDTF